MNRRQSLFSIPVAVSSIPAWASGFSRAEQINKPPLDSAPLAVRYIRRVQDMLRWIRRSQSENMLEASYAIARTVKNGGAVWTNWDMGHNNSYDFFPERNAIPAFVTFGYDTKTAKKGDLLLASRAAGWEDDIAAKDIFVVGSPCPWGGDARGRELLRPDVQKETIRQLSKIWVETNITTHGAIMDIPGSPAPFGPTSGILGLTTFWMIMADACRILAREGVSMKVSGDEPPLAGNGVPWISLEEPVMDRYFDTVLRQIDMIEAEMGSIAGIAAMAADTVLAGGKVYCYSRYRNSMAVEGHHRRGGLALTRGVCVQEGRLTSMDGYVPFEGTSRDVVIMGVWEPDDEVDLASLDTFRRAGLKIASLGPMTRDIAVPKGRTVPKESDIHAGRMCDTYGLFAVPGFERKVCPTSGAIINQLWWATCMAIAEDIMRRTGNTPGVFMSAALDGGNEHNRYVMEKYGERGY